MSEIILSLAPFGLITVGVGVAAYWAYQAYQKHNTAQEAKYAADLQLVKDYSDAQANPISDAKRANKLVRSRKDS